MAWLAWTMAAVAFALVVFSVWRGRLWWPLVTVTPPGWWVPPQALPVVVEPSAVLPPPRRELEP